jgi:hypothetical protein
VYNLTAVDAGFNRSRLVTFSITLPVPADLRTAARGFGIPDRGPTRTYQRLLEALRALPGVTAATAMTGLPLAQPSIIQGRGFESADETSGRYAVVNETLAKMFWNGRNPVGQQLRPGGGDMPVAVAGDVPIIRNPWFTVIGVARDVKQRVDEPVRPEVYVLVDQVASNPLAWAESGPPMIWVAFSPTTMHVVARTTLPLATLAPAIARVVREIEPTVPMARLREMDDVLSESIERPLLLAQLLTLFSTVAMLLAAMGTYGVLAYIVAERRFEIGIRIALGAARTSVLRQVMGQGLKLTIIGVIAGLAGALALNQLIASLLFGVQPTDAPTLAAVIATITLVGICASWLPAWRAARVDPVLALRHE